MPVGTGRCYPRASSMRDRPIEPEPLVRARSRLVFLRHGATMAPPGTYLGSQADPSLSDLGAAQARAAGERLAGRRFRLVLVSPLRRALETAQLALPDVSPTVDARLREIDMGDFTLLTWEQMKARDRAAARAWRTGAAAPGGEDARALWRRSIELGLELAGRLEPGQDALLVAHSGPIRALLASARGRSPGQDRGLRIPYGSLRSLRLTPAVVARWRSIFGDPSG